MPGTSVVPFRVNASLIALPNWSYPYAVTTLVAAAEATICRLRG